jgi:hypothetical protein
MIDLRTQGVRPATVSYTPLDLRGIKANLMGKVQEVESNANAGKDLMSKLDFKDGYATSGLAKDLQQEYTTKLQALVDGLYSTGDTRSFSSNLSRMANEMNVDPRARSGLKDFEMSKRYDQMAIDPNYATFEFLFTDDKTPGGNIAPIDWRNNPDLLTEENIVNFFGRVVPPENIYGDYTRIFAKELATITVQDLFAIDPETGTITFKTEQQIRDLPSEQIRFYEESKELGLTPAQALARSLREGTPEQRALYSQLATDYQGGTTNTAVNLRRSKELSQDEFIGEVVFQSFPYLGKTTYEQRLDTRGGGGGGGQTPTALDTTPVTTNALATLVFPESTDADKRQDLADYFDVGDESIPAISELVFNGTEEEKEVAGYFASVLTDWERNGDPQYQRLYANGAELRGAANSATEEILRATYFQGLPSFNQFVTSNNLLKEGETSLQYFQRLKNTIGYLGKSSDAELRDDKEDVISTYDGLAANADFVNQITFGVGVLTPQELRDYLATTGTMVSVSNNLGISDTKSLVDYNIEAYSKASNTVTVGDKEYGFLEFFQESGKLNDAELLEIKENHPIAFLELAKRDYMQRANLYYTDVLLQPGQLQNAALKDATTTMQQNWAARFPNVGPDFFAKWEVREYVTASEGGSTVTRSTGLESPRVTTELDVTSPYVLLEQDNASALVEKFIGAKDTSGMGDAAKAKIGNWTFGGILVPQGLQSQTALIFSHTTTEGAKVKHKTYMFTPKDPTQLSTNEVYMQMGLTQQTLASKKYLPIVTEGAALVGQTAQSIGQTLLEKVDVQDVNTDYFWTDTREQLNETQYFTVRQTINDEVDNPYNSGNLSVSAAINNGAEVYKIRKKDGTGTYTWREYFENFSPDPDQANTYMGVADYENFLISIFHNQEMLKERGANITDDKIRDLLVATEMGTLADIGDSFGLDFMDLLDTPITFIDRQEAFHHFSGQSRRSEDNNGNPRAGYFPK